MTVFSLLYSRTGNLYSRPTTGVLQCLPVGMFCFLKSSHLPKVPSECQQVPKFSQSEIAKEPKQVFWFGEQAQKMGNHQNQQMKAKDLAVPLDPPEMPVTGSKPKSFCLSSWALKPHSLNTDYSYTKAGRVNTDLRLGTGKEWVHRPLHT